MPNNRILIVGAGIAGPALAYWLNRQGYRPTVVERAETGRPGGQAIDVHGQALQVIDRMGLLEPVRAAQTGIRGMSFVDDRGKTLASTTAFTLTGGDHQGPDVELMRSDLMDLSIAASREGCEYVYGDALMGLKDTGTEVEVTFTSGATRGFDLVIGADGVNSATRAQVFDPNTYRIDRLGRYIAIATIPNFLNQDRWEIFHAAGPDRRVCYFAGRSSTRVMFTKTDPDLTLDRMNVSAQRALLRRHFGTDGWHTPRLLAEAAATDEFYFDDLRQVKMDTWSHGRVALVGDAAHCASPASGLGTSLALVGAYVLAGELGASLDDHAAAFTRYEHRMRPFVTACQDRARAGGNLYITKSRFWLQMQQIRLSNLPVLRTAMTRRTAGDKHQIANTIELPYYAHATTT